MTDYLKLVNDRIDALHPSCDTVLMSFPRSGNSWTRYVIENLTGRPTAGAIEADGAYYPCAAADPTLPEAAYKTHWMWPRIKERFGSMVFVVRDYRECMIRHFGADAICESLMREHADPHDFEMDAVRVNYMNLVKGFDGWTGKKLLIYYEEMVTDAPGQVRRVGEFLGCSQNAIQAFVDGISGHELKSKSLYAPGCQSGGNKTAFHAAKLDQKILQLWKNIMAEGSPELFQKYLGRYA